jgi:hypothetical protein
LCHGGMRLVLAANWFVPERLPPHVTASLADSNVPFGRLIAPLGGYRVPISAEMSADGTTLRHRALVCLASRARVAIVEERFLPAVLEYAVAT